MKCRFNPNVSPYVSPPCHHGATMRSATMCAAPYYVEGADTCNCGGTGGGTGCKKMKIHAGIMGCLANQPPCGVWLASTAGLSPTVYVRQCLGRGIRFALDGRQNNWSARTLCAGTYSANRNRDLPPTIPRCIHQQDPTAVPRIYLRQASVRWIVVVASLNVRRAVSRHARWSS